MSGRRRQAGRIRTCDRDTNDIVELLGNDVSIDDAHQVMVRSTEKLEINQKLQNEYRNRISHIYKFLETHYPDYYAVGVQFLTDADKDNLDQHWNKNDHDLIYQGLNVKFIKAFMAHAKKKKKNVVRTPIFVSTRMLFCGDPSKHLLLCHHHFMMNWKSF